MPKTLYEKVWENHLARPEADDAPAVMYIDLHLIHEVTSPQAFTELRRRGLSVRRPDRTLATMDHSTPTLKAQDGSLPILDEQASRQLNQLATNCRDFGVTLHDLSSDRRGIVHVMGPELGATWPGSTIVCGDSHTSTHGAFGALAFGIGTSEVGHVLATQCLLQRRAGTMAVNVEGSVGPGVTAKDIILAIIREIGVDGGTGRVIEYRGQAIRDLSMEGRMTVCNMSIEGGARAGMVAPDETTFEYLRGRPLAPKGAEFDKEADEWAALATDEDATFDKEVTLDAADIEPMVTWGTNPSMGVGVTGSIPNAAADAERDARALAYMDLAPGDPIAGRPVNVAFLGSCTNSRLSDLHAAAAILRGRKVHPNTTMLVVPGSQRVKAQAEAEGLDQIFIDAGAEWREPGCSMCIAMNGDRVDNGAYAISTSNRNFEGRQGRGARTFLASPMTVAASAVAGCVADPRDATPADAAEKEPACAP